MPGMSWYETAWLFGAAVGAALLWGIFASAVKRKGTYAPLLVLIATAALWFSGEALRLLIAKAAPASPAAAYAGYMALLGLAFIPSALLATVLVFAAEAEAQTADGPGRGHIAILLAPGCVTLLLGVCYARAPWATSAFSLYTILILIASASLCWRVMRRAQAEVQRLFYKLTAIALVGIAALIGMAYPLGGATHPGIGPVLSLVLFLSPIAPAYILGYFVYRYSFFRIVVNPALLYSALTGIVLTVYLLGIRRIAGGVGQLDSGFRPEVIEAFLLALLIFLFQPAKNRLQRAINRLFFKARYEYQHLLGELSQTLNVPLEIEQRLRTVVDAVGTVLKVHMVSLTLFDREGGQMQNVRTIGSRGLPGFPQPTVPFSEGLADRPDIEQVVEWLSANRRPLDTGELHRRRFVTRLVTRGVRLCIPVMQEQQVTGFLCLSEKKRSVPFSVEERELLVTLCNQIALAVENARLIEGRLAMERRMYEAERLSSLGLLSASIAHEVKNPLSSIKTIAAVLREDLEEDRTKTEDLSVILNEIDRLSHVVDRLLKFARPEQEEVFQTVALKTVVDDIVLILSHEAERRHVAIRSEVENGLTVLADLEDLKEILFNLILNGIQALEEHDGGEVTVAARHCPTEQGRPAGDGRGNVELTVADTGPGIPEDVRPHIFEPFYTTKISGTGLGLAIVKRDVERMGGSAEVRCGVQNGRGTVFAVRFPGGNDESKNPDCG